MFQGGRVKDRLRGGRKKGGLLKKTGWLGGLLVKRRLGGLGGLWRAGSLWLGGLWRAGSLWLGGLWLGGL